MFLTLWRRTFIISLGITFVLVLLLLIYHFKQRLTIASESKQDTMFEIINNLAQELNNIKMSLSNAVVSPASYPFSNVQNEEQNLTEVDLQASDLNDFSLTGQEEDAESDEETTDDEDSDISDSEDEDDKIVVSDEDEDEISVEDVDPEEKKEELTVDKPEEQIEESLEKEESNVKEEQELEASEPNFSKMNLGALKSYIVEKGLVEDASKMKKAQILALIEQHH